MSSANSNVAILPNPLGFSSNTTSTNQNTTTTTKNNNTVAANAPQLTHQANQNNQNSSFSKSEPTEEYDKNGARPNGQLSTSSPAGIAAAAAVTPDKLAKLLLTQGPLAIRHLTSHLATQIPGFAQLSLSKQRRLIIAALDNGDPITGCVFEKVGWGQWAARHVGSQHVKHMQAKINAAQNGTTGSNSRRNSSSGEVSEHFEKSPTRNGSGAGATTTVGVASVNGNSSGSGSVTPVSIPATAAAAAVASTKSRSPPVRKPSESFGWKNRRESITNANNDPHRDIIPRSPRLSGTANNASAVVTRSKLIHSVNNNEDAILSSSDEEDGDGEDNEENYSDDEEDGLNNRFQFHENKPKIPTAVIQPRSHSQVVYPSTPLLSGANAPTMRHHRSSFNNSTKGISKPKVRSRLGSFNNSSNSSNATANANLVDGYEPVDNLQEDLGNYRRRQSFNESFMRKSSSSPKRMSISNITNATNATPLSYSNSSNTSHTTANTNYSAVRNSNSTSSSYHSDTDEEDWASMGAASLRHESTSTSRPSISDNEIKIKRKNLDFREEAAAYALVNLSLA